MRNYFELLIIVAIGAMLFIMTGMVTKESARRTQCQANLRELYRAVQQYESAHGTLPPLYIAQRPQWLFWHHFVSPMVKDVRSFACPSDPRMSYLFEKGSPLFGGIVALTSCYGMNRFMLPVGAKKAGAPEFKLKYLKNPSHTVFLMDSVRPFVTPDLLWKDKRNFRHDGKANYIFADGSVKHLHQNFFGKFEGNKFITDFTRWHWR